MLNGHSLKPKHGARRKPGVVGRGSSSGWGTTAGRGTKGQRARSGSRKGLKYFGSKALIQSIPKLRGFTSLQAKPLTVSTAKLQRVFADGTIITHEELVKAGVAKNAKQTIKIVGNTKLEKKFTVKEIPVTAGAQSAIEAAGGAVHK